MSSLYIPNSGDVVWINFNPQVGHEQGGYRPAVVLSPFDYNNKTSLMICCPMTTQIKGYPFEVIIEGEPPSAVLTDQIKSLDWRKRSIKHKGRVTPTELERICTMIRVLIG